MTSTKLLHYILLIGFTFVLLFTCTKTRVDEHIEGQEQVSHPPPPPPTSPAFSQWYCGDTIAYGRFIGSVVTVINWEGITYWQTRVEPVPMWLPYKTHRLICPDKIRGGTLVADTVHMEEDQLFGLVKL